MKCEAKLFSLGVLQQRRNIFKTDPVYQRQGSVWSESKKQLFIDSIVNGYDIPKIYIHKLGEGDDGYGSRTYAVVDGKQRLEAIWDFFDNKFALADDFEYKGNVLPMDEKEHGVPQAGFSFSDFNEHWKEEFKVESLSFVIIEDADEQDIEDLFSRLNHAEPLNAAEKRNAFGGDMIRIIRDVAKGHKFFKKKLPFDDKRYIHHDIAARLLLIEKRVVWDGDEPYCDLKKRFLDKLVKEHRSIKEEDKDKLKKAVNDQLNGLVQVFEEEDPLLRKSGYSQLYYLFVKQEEKEYACERKDIRLFLVDFSSEREKSLATSPEEKEDSRHIFLDEFERLMQQGNDRYSLRDRVMILIKFLLQANPSIKAKDKRRIFTPEQRSVIFMKSGRVCAECGKKLASIEEFDADHIIPWSKGGETSVANGRALCQTCNRSKGAR